jgi:hypothetical protein
MAIKMMMRNEVPGKDAGFCRVTEVGGGAAAAATQESVAARSAEKPFMTLHKVDSYIVQNKFWGVREDDF